MYITVSTNAPTDISDVSEICSRQHDLLPLASLFFQKLKISFSIYLNGIYTVVKKIQGKNKKFILGSKVLTANTLLIFFISTPVFGCETLSQVCTSEVSTSCSSLFLSCVLENANVLEEGCSLPDAFLLHSMAL